MTYIIFTGPSWLFIELKDDLQALDIANSKSTCTRVEDIEGRIVYDSRNMHNGKTKIKPR